MNCRSLCFLQMAITAFLISMLAASPGFAFFQESSSPAENQYRYSVDLGKSKEDRLTIELLAPTIAAEKIDFLMPRMVPGIYGVEDYGQYLSKLEAFDAQGKRLPITEISRNRWRIANAKQLHRLTYQIDDSWEAFGPARDGETFYRSAGSSFDSGERYIINHNCLFGYFEGMGDLPFEISIAHPKELKVACSLSDRCDEADLDRFHAPNYRKLVDCPMVYGKADIAKFDVGGAEISIAVFTDGEMQNAIHFARILKPIVQGQANYLGGKLPVKGYTFILVWEQGLEKGFFIGDGLEHSYSTLCLINTSSLKNVEKFVTDLASHELFHVVTPLNIHSEEVANFDFNQPKLSQHLWLYEGMTEYATIHMPICEKLVSEASFLESVARKVQQMRPFRNDLSLTELSKKSVKFQNQYYNIYLKGALIGLCLDIRLRELSKGEYGTRDMIRQLSQKYGPDRPFKDDELFDVITEMTYPEIRTWFADYVEGIKPLPLQESLAKVGIDFDPSTGTIKPMESASESQQALKRSWLGASQ